jgi:Protein of unknown function (DUF3455)
LDGLAPQPDRIRVTPLSLTAVDDFFAEHPAQMSYISVRGRGLTDRRNRSMNKRFCLLALAVLLAASTCFLSPLVLAQQDEHQAPPQLQPPAGEQLVLQLHAKGDQIYTCKGESAPFSWTLKAPEAQLFDKKDQLIGRHFAGPTWQVNDGSRVTGKASVSVESPDAESIPWLLVKAVNHEGAGVLSRVTSIERLNTKGGKAPGSGCDADHVNQEVRVSYSADYFFYAPK